MSLEGKVAIVTGGARGIGFAIAQRFAREGAKVVIADLLREEGQAAAAAILTAGGEALFVEVDVRVEDEVACLVDDIFNQFDGINILVNNAGVLDPGNTTVTDLRRDDWDRVLAVNLTGAFLCAKHVIPTMVEQRSGSIVMIASIDAITGYSKPHAQIAYAASKGGLLALTRSLAGSYGGFGIRCTAICPGPVKTAMNRAVLATEVECAKRLVKIPTGRFTQPEDVAALAVFLASDESSQITGSWIGLDGGATGFLY